MKDIIKLLISSILIIISFFIWYYYSKQEILKNKQLICNEKIN